MRSVYRRDHRVVKVVLRHTPEPKKYSVKTIKRKDSQRDGGKIWPVPAVAVAKIFMSWWDKKEKKEAIVKN